MNPKKSKIQIDGILVVDKPSDWTSHDVVAKVRNSFKLNKVGHAGTLDPIATGVLILLSGKATKSSNKLMAGEKEYLFTIKFGLSTDTQDITGKTLKETENPTPLSAEELERILKDFRGEISQIPPMFSAIKVKGKKLYELGRKGIVIEREPKIITIHELTLESLEWPSATIKAVCSKGTYIRTICNDIGEKAGCGACMEKLIRLRSGNYSIKDAHQLPEILNWSPEIFKEKVLPIP